MAHRCLLSVASFSPYSHVRVFPAGVQPRFFHFPYPRAPALPQAHLTAHSLGSLLPPGCSALGGGHRPSLSYAGPRGITAPPAPHSLTRGHKAVILPSTTVCLGRGVWYTGSPGNLWCPNQATWGSFPGAWIPASPWGVAAGCLAVQLLWSTTTSPPLSGTY